MTFQINGTTGIDNAAVNSTVANVGNFTTVNLSTGVLSTTIGQILNFGSAASDKMQLDLTGNLKLLTTDAAFQNASGQKFSPYNLKNKVINGSFNIWQRGITQTSVGYGSDDRFYNYHNGSTKTHTREIFTLGQTDVADNPKYYSRTVVTSVAGANNAVFKRHSIEDVTKSSGKTYTLSFWAKANAAKNIAVNFFQSFGTGGYTSDRINAIGTTLINLTANWQKISTTVTFPSVARKSIGTNNDDAFGFEIYFDAGSNFNARTNSLGQQSGTFDIAQIQLEEGSVATEFETLPIGFELRLCQRYYEQLGFANDVFVGINYGVAAGVGGAQCNVTFKAIKRKIPTVTKFGTWFVYNCAQPVPLQIDKNGFVLTAASTASNTTCEFYNNSSDDYIIIDAEI